MNKLFSFTVLSFFIIGCTTQPEPISISNNKATAELFLIGEMSMNGYHYVGTRNNMMVFQNRRNKKIASFSLSGDNKSASIKYLGKEEDKNIKSTLNRVKTYSELWKDKNDKQVTFSENDSFQRKTNAGDNNSYPEDKFNSKENLELLPKGNSNYRGMNDPALKNRL